MHLRKTAGHWVLDSLNEIELQLLARLPFAADPEGSSEAERKLFPSPLAGPVDTEEELDLIADWQEYVRPELEDRFQGHLRRVLEDLGDVRPVPEEEEGPRVAEQASGENEEAGLYRRRKRTKDEADDASGEYQLELSDAAAEHWYSALNQARIVLSQRYDLHDDGPEELLEFLLRQSEGAEPEMPPEDVAARWQAIMQCQFYGAIQDWLLNHVMSDEE